MRHKNMSHGTFQMSLWVTRGVGRLVLIVARRPGTLGRQRTCAVSASTSQVVRGGYAESKVRRCWVFRFSSVRGDGERGTADDDR
jgi:hypothetical protein